MADTDREKGLEKQCMEEDKGRRKIARLAYRKLREAVGREELRAVILPPRAIFSIHTERQLSTQTGAQ